MSAFLLRTACAHLSDEEFLDLAWNQRDLYLTHQIEHTQKIGYTGLIVTGAVAATGLIVGVEAGHGVSAIGKAMEGPSP
jgi:hypothetical protein